MYLRRSLLTLVCFLLLPTSAFADVSYAASYSGKDVSGASTTLTLANVNCGQGALCKFTLVWLQTAAQTASTPTYGGSTTGITLIVPSGAPSGCISGGCVQTWYACGLTGTQSVVFTVSAAAKTFGAVDVYSAVDCAGTPVGTSIQSSSSGGAATGVTTNITVATGGMAADSLYVRDDVSATNTAGTGQTVRSTQVGTDTGGGGPVSLDSTASNAATSTSSHSFAFTCTTGRPYLVMIAMYPKVIASVNSVTYNSISLSQVNTIGTNDAAYIYARADGSGCDGASHNAVITYSAAADNSNALAISFSGAHATTPFTNDTTASNSTTNISIIVPSVTTGDMAVGVMATINAVTVTEGTQVAQIGTSHIGTFVRRSDNGTMSGTQALAEAWVMAGIRVVEAAGAGGDAISLWTSDKLNATSMAWNWVSSENFVHIVTPMNPSTGGGGGCSGRLLLLRVGGC